MVNDRDILALRLRLERARERLLAGRLGEAAAWRLLRRTHRLMDRAAGSVYLPTLQVIYSLVQALWVNTRQQEQLRQIKAELD